jgi:sugar phosphate isomerase/epimerase
MGLNQKKKKKMTQTRRTFLQTSAAIAALSLLGSKIPAAANEKATPKPIGLQLYSARELMQQAPEATLAALAEIGYQHFEAYGYRDGKLFGKTPTDLRAFLETLHTPLTSSHVNIPLLPPGENKAAWDQWRQTTHHTAQAGCRWITIASYPTAQIKTLTDLQHLAAQYNHCAEIAKGDGLRFAFHNHHDELSPLQGAIPYDLLIEQTDPALVTFQLDTGHIHLGGHTCEAYIHRYPSRFPTWHLRDVNDQGEGVNLGTGKVNFQALFAAAPQAKLEDYYVEQGQHTHPVLDSLRHNHQYITQAPHIPN